jgi:hypothetical protein
MAPRVVAKSATSVANRDTLLATAPRVVVAMAVVLVQAVGVTVAAMAVVVRRLATPVVASVI